MFETDKTGVQAGISIFQKDHNYITLTIEKYKEQYLLKLLLKEQKNEPVVIKNKILKIW